MGRETNRRAKLILRPFKCAYTMMDRELLCHEDGNLWFVVLNIRLNNVHLCYFEQAIVQKPDVVTL